MNRAALHPALPLLRALLAPDPSGIARLLQHQPPAMAELHWLAEQGLGPFVYHHLRAHDCLALLSEEGRSLLYTSHAQAALLEAIQHEATTALAALAQAGVEVVVLKGMALAHTVYPNPRCRPRSDLDLWIPAAQRADAQAALLTVGYTLTEPAAPDAPEGEDKFGREGMAGGLIELQWPALRGEWLRHCATVDHEGMWQRRWLVPFGGQVAAILSPEDTLLHLCFHQAINHQFTFPCWLRSLLDVHLVLHTYPIEWDALLERARTWGLATVTWTVLELAQGLLGTLVPQRVLSALAPAAPRRAAIRRLPLARSVLEMWPSDYHSRRFLIQLLLVPRPAAALALLRHALAPDAAWLAARYGEEAPWRARLLHPLRLLGGSRK